MPATARNSLPAPKVWIAVGAMLLLTAIALLSLIRRSNHPNAAPDASWQPPYQEHMREIAAALAEFHTVRGTDTEPYPYDLRQLQSMGFVDDMKSLLAVKLEHAGDWQYFSAADGENPKAPLLVSPPLRDAPDGPAYLLMTTDGTISLVRGKELEESFRISPLPPVKLPAPVEEIR